MSSQHTHNRKFIKRFKEVCGTRQPKEIATLLGISNSAAKNYLHGRLPDSKILIVISEKTPYSVHWLLTGTGDKFVDQTVKKGMDSLLESLTELATPSVLLKFGEVLAEFRLKDRHTSKDSPKTVTLTADKIREEKAKEKDPSNLPT